LTLFYESALIPAIGGGRPLGAGVLCVPFHRRPGIDRGGGFYWPVSGLAEGAGSSPRWWGEWGREGLILSLGERTFLDLFVWINVPSGKITGSSMLFKPVNYED
jgi:hypothetical protein